MDLLELVEGYNSGFGLYYVDLDDPDLKRYPKLSAHWYSHFLKGGRVRKGSNNYIEALGNSRHVPSDTLKFSFSSDKWKMYLTEELLNSMSNVSVFCKLLSPVSWYCTMDFFFFFYRMPIHCIVKGLEMTETTDTRVFKHVDQRVGGSPDR